MRKRRKSRNSSFGKQASLQITFKKINSYNLTFYTIKILIILMRAVLLSLLKNII